MSEIDDIFASKGKPRDIPPSAAPSSSQIPKSSTSLDASRKEKQKQKKKQKKSGENKPPHTNVADPDLSTPIKRPAPETIIDPSVQSSSAKRRKVDQPDPVPKKKSKKESEDHKFKDSRGLGSRRQTEEGWSIYKEDELGISNEGGDTPLCPFDCECCF